MEKVNNRIEQIGVKYGLWVAAGLIAFFLIMKAVGLVHNFELRIFNIFILAVGIIAAIVKFKSMSDKKYVPYMKGLSLGMLTTGVAVLTFGVFLIFYLLLFDAALMAQIKEVESFGSLLNPFTVAIVIIMEGGFSGVILTFATMQYMKFSLLTASKEPRNKTSVYTAKTLQSTR